MLNADRAPYFHSCPRCGDGGLQRFRTHAYCVNCNYEEIYQSDELCVIPQWAIEALKTAKPKSIIQEIRSEEKEYALESAV
jgi:hypothetical protein